MTEFATDRLARLFICLALFWAHGCAMGGNERERSLGSGLLQMNENNNNLTHFPGKEQVAKLVGLPSWLTGSNAFGQIKERLGRNEPALSSIISSLVFCIKSRSNGFSFAG